MRELERIEIDVETELRSEREGVGLRIMSGDFNALTLEDYSEQELSRVAEVRKNNRWEEPRGDVTRYVEQVMEFSDSKCLLRDEDDLNGPLSTCRFNTRIDYVYFKKGAGGVELKVDALKHVEDSASDHNMVLADIAINQYTG